MFAGRTDAARDPKTLEVALGKARYLADPRVALAAWLALQMHRPLLVEGPPGVGKTDLARALGEALGRRVVRLQCYEGLDEAKALYEWDYAKQMLTTQILRDVIAAQLGGASSIEEAVSRVMKSDTSFFHERFLLKRPLLAALASETPVVLLIDEVDRADPEFEAFLLEILSELQVTIPELGTIRADPNHPPLCLLTTNGSRDMTDALRRRCLHAFLDYPEPSREIAILRLAVPKLEEALAAKMVAFVGKLRALDLRKAPAISETIDWARAVLLLGRSSLDRALIDDTLGLLLKHHADRLEVETKLAGMLG